MNMKNQYKNITEICREIDLIVEKKNNNHDYKRLNLDLRNVLHKELIYSEIDLFCITVLKIANTKNRILRYLEGDFWDFINELPFNIIQTHDFEILEVEEMEFSEDYPNQAKKILSRLIGLSREILGLPNDNSKGSDVRRAGALMLIAELFEYYHIPNVKELFLNSIRSKNKKEQYRALEGLEVYYDTTEDEIDDNITKVLHQIIKETEDRTIVSTCLQIQINAGLIDELTAVSEIDNWKEEHHW
jgi:hypothetical protein